MTKYEQIMPGVIQFTPPAVTQSVLEEQEKSFQRIEVAYERFLREQNNSKTGSELFNK